MANQIVKLKKGSDYLYPYADLCGIDTSNILASSISSSYTATQDCMVVLHNNGGYAIATIDNVATISGGNNDGSFILLKKGQILTLVQGYPLTKIFGIKY